MVLPSCTFYHSGMEGYLISWESLNSLILIQSLHKLKRDLDGHTLKLIPYLGLVQKKKKTFTSGLWESSQWFSVLTSSWLTKPTTPSEWVMEGTNPACVTWEGTPSDLNRSFVTSTTPLGLKRSPHSHTSVSSETWKVWNKRWVKKKKKKFRKMPLVYNERQKPGVTLSLISARPSCFCPHSPQPPTFFPPTGFTTPHFRSSWRFTGSESTQDPLS